MSNLQIMRSFNAISEEFMSDDFCLHTVSSLITCIRLHRKNLSSDQIKDLMEIPIDVLTNDVVLTDSEEFQTHAEYFRGNIGGLANEHEYLRYFVSRLEAKELTINDMISYTKYIQDNPTLYQSDYLLTQLSQLQSVR